MANDLIEQVYVMEPLKKKKKPYIMGLRELQEAGRVICLKGAWRLFAPPPPRRPTPRYLFHLVVPELNPL